MITRIITRWQSLWELFDCRNFLQSGHDQLRVLAVSVQNIVDRSQDLCLSLLISSIWYGVRSRFRIQIADKKVYSFLYVLLQKQIEC